MRGRKPEDIWIRLFSKVMIDKTPLDQETRLGLVLQGVNSRCWLFTGAQDNEGYGKIIFEGRMQPAHRVSAYLFGLLNIQDRHQQVNHRCDTRTCIHPQHFCIGNQTENMKDRYQTPAERFVRVQEYNERLERLAKEPIDEARDKALKMLMWKMGLFK